MTKPEGHQIESSTDFDVLNHDEYQISIINRFDSDGEQVNFQVYGKSISLIILEINKL